MRNSLSEQLARVAAARRLCDPYIVAFFSNIRRVDSLTSGLPLRAYETRALLTPAASATSLIRTGRRRTPFAGRLLGLRSLGVMRGGLQRYGS